MLIWKLTPFATDDPFWLASSHRAPVIVRAPDEESARSAAQHQFGVAARFPAGTRIVGAPWMRPNLARAEVVEDSRYATDGPLEVLEPSFETDLAARPPPKPPKR
jgi:hypothetical protein